MSEVKSPTPVKLINQLSLNSNGSSEGDSTEQHEDTEITLDQADAWGFSRPTNQSQVRKKKEFKGNLKKVNQILFICCRVWLPCP